VEQQTMAGTDPGMVEAAGRIGRELPWLSVLIPVYNVSAYIEACLHSVLKQIDGDCGIEVLVLDDAGTDDAWPKVERMALRFPQRPRLLRHPVNRGISAARNTLLAEATGQYVWFLDSDDVFLPGAIAGLRKVIQSDAPDLVLCDFRFLYDRPNWHRRLRATRRRVSFDRGGTQVSTDRNALARGLLQARQLHVWSKIGRRDVWRQAPFPEGRHFEDVAVVAALVAAAGSWRHVPHAWIGYRQREGSILATMTQRSMQDHLIALRDLREGLAGPANRLDADVQAALDYFCLRALASVARDLPPDNAALDGECRACLAEIFPQSPRQVLDACRQRGWWLRAWRAQRALAARGWLQG
jgi:hypothetical protein